MSGNTQSFADLMAYQRQTEALAERLGWESGNCQTSEQRKNHQPEWSHMYNWHRPHGSLNSKPPISRLGQPMDNLLKFLI